MTAMNVSLTKELAAIVKKKVKSGLYSNASEVIREAIRNLDTNQELIHELKLARLKQALAKGIEQTKNREFVDFSVEKLIKKLNKSAQN